MRDQDRDRKTFVTHAGVGIYYKLSPQWAIQSSVRRYVSTRYNTQDDLISMEVVYRLSKGEWQ